MQNLLEINLQAVTAYIYTKLFTYNVTHDPTNAILWIVNKKTTNLAGGIRANNRKFSYREFMSLQSRITVELFVIALEYESI